jgi:Rrf2 family protein
MKISTRSEYATKALLYLAIAEENRSDSKPAQIPAIAHQCDIPLKYLEQILVVLRNHGFVASRRGVTGGYFLVKNPQEITIGEVVRLMDGANNVGANLPDCLPSDAICAAVRSVWAKVDHAIVSAMDNITLATLSDDVKAIKAKQDISSLMFYI